VSRRRFPQARLSTAEQRNCGDPGSVLWTARVLVVEDSPELEVCERKVGRALVALGSDALELLPRTSSGKRGIGRRRRSRQCLDGLPTRGCGGQVTGTPGSEEPTGSAGSVTSTGRWRRVETLVSMIASEGPLSLIPMRALLAFPPTPVGTPARPRFGPAAHPRERRVGARGHRLDAESAQGDIVWTPSRQVTTRRTGPDQSSPDSTGTCGDRPQVCGRASARLWTSLRKSTELENGARKALSGCGPVP
jgi:hypothetical protein